MKGHREEIWSYSTKLKKKKDKYIYYTDVVVWWAQHGIPGGVSQAARDAHRASAMLKRFRSTKKSNRMMRCSRTVGLLGLSRLTRKSVRVMKCLILFEGPLHELTDCRGFLRRLQLLNALKGRLGDNVRIYFSRESASTPFDAETPRGVCYLQQRGFFFTRQHNETE